MKKAKYATREEWLHAVKNQLAPLFAEHGKPIPANVRLGLGWPSIKQAHGECWPVGASSDRHIEIIMSPAHDDAVAIAATLTHELCHAVAGTPCGHTGPFAALMKKLGFAPPMTGATPKLALARKLAIIVKAVGPYPHGKLNGAYSDGRKKQSTRMIKAACETCGYTVRLTRKWLEVGTPICPTSGHGAMLADDPEDGSDE